MTYWKSFNFFERILTLYRNTHFYWHRGYTRPKKSRHLFFHKKDLQKISQYSEILFGDLILCSNRFCSNFDSDCLFIIIYSDENISLENFVMSLFGHVYLRRVKDRSSCHFWPIISRGGIQNKKIVKYQILFSHTKYIYHKFIKLIILYISYHFLKIHWQARKFGYVDGE